MSREADSLFYGSWRLAQEQCQAFYDDYAQGCLLQTIGNQEWLLREAFGRYLTDPFRDEEDETLYWENRIHTKYGSQVPATAFLEAGDLSTRILPLVRSQLFYRNNNYHALYGLPFISILGMPSFSSWRHQGIRGIENERAFSH